VAAVAVGRIWLGLVRGWWLLFIREEKGSRWMVVEGDVELGSSPLPDMELLSYVERRRERGCRLPLRERKDLGQMLVGLPL
jgi:hypothetical protein